MRDVNCCYFIVLRCYWGHLIHWNCCDLCHWFIYESDRLFQWLIHWRFLWIMKFYWIFRLCLGCHRIKDRFIHWVVIDSTIRLDLGQQITIENRQLVSFLIRRLIFNLRREIIDRTKVDCINLTRYDGCRNLRDRLIHWSWLEVDVFIT